MMNLVAGREREFSHIFRIPAARAYRQAERPRLRAVELPPRARGRLRALVATGALGTLVSLASLFLPLHEFQGEVHTPCDDGGWFALVPQYLGQLHSEAPRLRVRCIKQEGLPAIKLLVWIASAWGGPEASLRIGLALEELPDPFSR